MKQKSDPEETEYKKGITIDTNPHQVIAIIVIFLAMFVLPVQAYTLYKNSKTPQTATYTTQNPAAQNESSSEGDVLGAFDSVIPESLKASGSNFGNYILYGGIAGLILAAIIFLAIIIK